MRGSSVVPRTGSYTFFPNSNVVMIAPVISSSWNGGSAGKSRSEEPRLYVTRPSFPESLSFACEM